MADGTKKLTERFGIHLFGEQAMHDRLSRDSYRTLQEIMKSGGELTAKIADEVASAMKEWALEHGATHYAHWFQPLNGATAEKHEAFLVPLLEGGSITEFSGKMLIKGEADGSAFPTGGLRQTFEARGYTMWDCTSPAFLRSDSTGVTLCIPTAFCSYNGEALDEKTPLLRSIKALSKQALRVLYLFGDHSARMVMPNIGVEQEYFLVSKENYRRRMDLRLTGHTLFGARPAKCQELSDHYSAVLDERIAGFMRELDEELWKMGVPAKTQHNEAAPAQHELVPVYTSANIAADHNQIIMETLGRVAGHHGLACLLDEKPFAYLNGSGKHNNWSIATDSGVNLLEPGDTPYENAKFLLFICAVIRAIDRHAGLLRLSCASAGNDRRLGGYEAPPAILSVYLGDQFRKVLEDVAEGIAAPEDSTRVMDFGVPSLPKLTADSSDRNRTASFAFTGNKFEYRMLGASMSVSFVNTVLNTIVAAVLDEFASRLEAAENFDSEIQQIIAETWHENNRILFDGNGYSEDWTKEAERRGMPNLPTTVDAVPVLLEQNTVDLFEWYGVCSADELKARYDVMLSNYCRSVTIEARVMLEMAEREIFPAVNRYVSDLAETAARLQAIGANAAGPENRTRQLADTLAEMMSCCEALRTLILQEEENADSLATATWCRDHLIPTMASVREICDRLERLTDRTQWPFPTYFDLLYDV